MGTSKNLLRSEILIPSSETRKMSKKTGGVAVRYVDGFFEKSDAVVAERAKEMMAASLAGTAKEPIVRFWSVTLDPGIERMMPE